MWKGYVVQGDKQAITEGIRRFCTNIVNPDQPQDVMMFFLHHLFSKGNKFSCLFVSSNV